MPNQIAEAQQLSTEIFERVQGNRSRPILRNDQKAAAFAAYLSVSGLR